MDRESYNIAIIGFGPKGLYGLERLLANIVNEGIDSKIAVHLFNRNGFFGAGDVYRCDQPDYLLMNYANHNIDFRCPKDPVLDIPEIKNFVEWSKNAHSNANVIDPEGFSSRAEVGRYLMNCLSHLLGNAPKNVSIITHKTTVTSIVPNEEGITIKTEDSGDGLDDVVFRKLLITTGHFWNARNPASQSAKKNYIDHIYPVDKKMDFIKSQSLVAIKGMGLTFIDAVLTLTEGRGGSFEETAEGFLTYRHSGSEPRKIYPFSRSGVPMIPRNGRPDKKPLRYFTDQNLPVSDASKLNFELQILPLIVQEMYVAYYKVLFQKMGCTFEIFEDFRNIENQVDGFHERYPSSIRFDWETLVHPFKNKVQQTNKEVASYLAHVISEAEQGMASPLMAATSVWRRISLHFNERYCHGGLDAASHRLFDEHYFGVFNRMAYGPPITNMKKILALVDFGLLDFTVSINPKLETNQNDVNYNLKCEELNVEVDYLINATIPKSNGPKHGNGLFSNLLKNGVVRLYENKDEDSYRPGCVDLDVLGRPYGANGILCKDITFYGTPTEGITFDNDTLSRTRNDFVSTWASDITKELKMKERKNSKVNEIEEIR